MDLPKKLGPLGASNANTLLRRWRWHLVFLSVAVIGVVLAIARVAPEFPSQIEVALDAKVDDAVSWMVAHWRGFFQEIKFALLKVLVPLEDFLLWLPWWLVTGGVVLLAWRIAGIGVALVSLAGLFFLGIVNIWDATMQTLAVVGTATVISVLVAVPMGIAMAKSNVVEAIMRPVLDTMQTMPSFVYLIPAIYFLGLGKVPAVFATMVYAVPPAMRLTNLGIRLVSPELKEAARAFGTTPWQMLIKVELPLARPTIMAGINQTTMMALAMVVIASLVGNPGLGAHVLEGIQGLAFGKGLMAGIGIVVMAVIIDRITQGFAKEARPNGP